MTDTLKQALVAAKFHPSASHVTPDYRDGWNHATDAAIASLQASLAAPPDTTGRVEVVAVNPARFSTWAAGEGYDTAQTYDTERSRWVFLNPMTADLWKAWQAASPSSAGGVGSEALVRAVIDHIDGWKSATFGWQGDPDPAKAWRNQQAAIENHAAECLRRIRVTLAATASPAPAVVQGEVPRG